MTVAEVAKMKKRTKRQNTDPKFAVQRQYMLRKQTFKDKSEIMSVSKTSWKWFEETCSFITGISLDPRQPMKANLS